MLGKIRIGKIKLPSGLRAGITLIFIWFLIFIFFTVFIPLLAQQADELASINVNSVVENMKEPLQKVQSWFAAIQFEQGENFSVKEYASEKLAELFEISYLSNFLAFLAGTLGDLFVAVFSISFISFFFLKDDQLFTNSILAFVPNKYMDETRHVIASIARLLKRYFIGVMIEVLSVITLVFIGLNIIGLDVGNALVIAAFAGVLNVIPYVGPFIGASIGIIIGIATNLHLNFYYELLPLVGLMSLVFISVQLIDNVVFQPLIYSNSVNAHPLEVFLVILIAGNLAGIPGMILAIPAYTILRVVAKEFFYGIKVIRQLTKNM